MNNATPQELKDTFLKIGDLLHDAPYDLPDNVGEDEVLETFPKLQRLAVELAIAGGTHPDEVDVVLASQSSETLQKLVEYLHNRVFSDVIDAVKVLQHLEGRTEVLRK
jgi:hypothetical protein